MRDLDDFADEERELDRLLAKARPIIDEAKGRAEVVQAVKALAEAQSKDRDDLAISEASFNKWRAIHKYIYARPFRLSPHLQRSDQWREMQERYGGVAKEVQDWIGQQIEVADNRERDIPDMRERRDGPCYLILLEYAGNRKRTDLAILHWTREQHGS